MVLEKRVRPVLLNSLRQALLEKWGISKEGIIDIVLNGVMPVDEHLKMEDFLDKYKILINF